jgi:glycosyltransferase involved in cell wall biosynthesis
MSSTSTLSVLIPCYNAGDLLAAALDSVFNQDVSCEILVQDGNSGEATQRVLQEYRQRIRAYSEPDEGQADALNKALRKCSGDVVGWLNADDLYSPQVFSKAINLFKIDPTLDVVYGDFSIIDAEGRQLRRYEVSTWDWHHFYTRGCTVFSGATFFRRSIFERFGVFRTDLHYCMDFEFLLRIARSVNVTHVPDVLGSLRVHGNSKSVSHPSRFLREAYAVRLEYGQHRFARPEAVYAGVRDFGVMLAQPLRFSRWWSVLRPRRGL